MLLTQAESIHGNYDSSTVPRSKPRAAAEPELERHWERRPAQLYRVTPKGQPNRKLQHRNPFLCAVTEAACASERLFGGGAAAASCCEPSSRQAVTAEGSAGARHSAAARFPTTMPVDLLAERPACVAAFNFLLLKEISKSP
ncbi:hypothetical protein FQA47_023658 [Oryzias melastigma]|uniref:Uncharacterized protein n=1 Tax=Oryzias melastigma TaxID=30732 RepID=A0A834L0X6_ORYME|nr:hypothetical protein FQA47_023658 [Oryzias melastigma]